MGSRSSCITESLEALAAGKTITLGSFQRCAAFLSLDTLDAHGLSQEAPERFGLRRTSFRPDVERFRGALQPQLLEQMKHMTRSSKVSTADEAFLQSILQKASKHGSEFFIERPEF